MLGQSANVIQIAKGHESEPTDRLSHQGQPAAAEAALATWEA
jgi:hypothetical protein